MIDSLSIAVHAFDSRVSMSFSFYEPLLSRYVNLSTSFRELPSSMAGLIKAHVFNFACIDMEASACGGLF